MTNYKSASSLLSDEYYADPCQKVRKTCRRWMEEEKDWESQGRRSVAIRNENMTKLADIILKKKSEQPLWIEWDEENWHYQGGKFTGTDVQRQERVALYILALDAINFCFWPCQKYPEENHINSLEYEHLAVALKKLAEVDDNNFTEDMSSYFFSPHRLAEMTEDSMRSSMEQNLDGHYLDNMKKRSELWREVGQVLLTQFDGSASKLIAQAGGSAPKLVELVFSHLPGFRDEVIEGANRIVFLKRAQIFVGDINAALKLNLEGLDQLTTFADYRVPQILRHFDILEYSPALASVVDSGVEIEKDSCDEISIRAATVVGVEELVKVLNADDTLRNVGEPFNDVNVDWYLWQVSEKMHHEGLLKPFHKVRTHFY